MNNISGLRRKATTMLLKIIRNEAVNGAGRASLRGSFEAEVPEILQKKFCECDKQEKSTKF